MTIMPEHAKKITLSLTSGLVGVSITLVVAFATLSGERAKYMAMVDRHESESIELKKQLTALYVELNERTMKIQSEVSWIKGHLEKQP